MLYGEEGRGGNLCTSEGQKRARAFVVPPPPFMAVAGRIEACHPASQIYIYLCLCHG